VERWNSGSYISLPLGRGDMTRARPEKRKYKNNQKRNAKGTEAGHRSLNKKTSINQDSGGRQSRVISKKDLLLKQKTKIPTILSSRKKKQNGGGGTKPVPKLKGEVAKGVTRKGLGLGG